MRVVFVFGIQNLYKILDRLRWLVNEIAEKLLTIFLEGYSSKFVEFGFWVCFLEIIGF
jgi:hypothetical protein